MTAVLASIQNRLDTAKQEIDTNANTIKEVIEDLSIPSITEDIHAILNGVIYEFPKVCRCPLPTKQVSTWQCALEIYFYMCMEGL